MVLYGDNSAIFKRTSWELWHWVGPFTLHIHMKSAHVLSQGNSRRWAQDVPPLARTESESRGSHTVQPLLCPVAHSGLSLRGCNYCPLVGRVPRLQPLWKASLSGHSCSPLRTHMSLLLGDCLWLILSPAFWILLFSSKKGFTVCDSRATHGRPAFLTVCQAPVASNNARRPLEGQTGRQSPGD